MDLGWIVNFVDFSGLVADQRATGRVIRPRTALLADSADSVRGVDPAEFTGFAFGQQTTRAIRPTFLASGSGLRWACVSQRTTMRANLSTERFVSRWSGFPH